MDADAICSTSREKHCLIWNNYTFWECRQLKNGNFNFRWINKICKASVIVNNSDQIIEQSKSSEHNHDEYTKQVISIVIIRITLEKKIENYLHTRPNKLIRSELINTDVAENMEHGDLKLIYRTNIIWCTNKAFSHTTIKLWRVFKAAFRNEINVII